MAEEKKRGREINLKLVDLFFTLLYNIGIVDKKCRRFLKNIMSSKYWEEIIYNHFTLKIIVNLKEYELCDLYLTPIKSTKDYMCKTYIGEVICKDTIQPVFDMFSAYDLESAKAKAEVFVMKQIDKKKDKLESEIYKYDRILEELK